jgi:hypothetical protein
VEIDGEPYWDGGYSGNPTITPLVRECAARDTLLVQINPVERPGAPRSARDILNRLNEVSFNATLLKELRMIAVVRQVASTGNCEAAHRAEMCIHRITSAIMTDLGYSSKLNAEWAFLCMLREEGCRSAGFPGGPFRRSGPSLNLRADGAGLKTRAVRPCCMVFPSAASRVQLPGRIMLLDSPACSAANRSGPLNG